VTLVEFLRARLDEDEDAAHAAENDPGYQAADGYEPWYANNADSSGDAIVAMHPTRALADVEAKRRIIDLADQASGLDEQVDAAFSSEPRDLTAEPYVGDLILRALTQPYADHPDFDPTWRI
jgi:Family of unknown function (DUF6221)